jgi:hypothetical protein
MELFLSKIPGTTKGIYNTQSNGQHSLPERFLYLWPDAASSFEDMEKATGGFVYSDMLRSAEESLEACRTKRGVQPPAYSGHNFGFSFDVAVDETLTLRGYTYTQLLDVLAQHGWFCHRRDGAAGYGQSESWHFNHFGDEAEKYLSKATPTSDWAAPLEALIETTYGDQLALDLVGVQEALASLKMYRAEVDGIMGPLTEQAIGVFQRAWRCPETGIADGRTQRTLAFVTSTHKIV